MDNVESNIAKSVSKRDSANTSTRNRKRRKKNNNKKFIALIAGVLVIVVLGIVLIVGALDKDDKKDSVKVEQQDDNNDKEADKDVTSTIDEMLEQEATVIETGEVRLFFPEKWSEQVRTEEVEGETRVVKFYGKVEGKEEVELFDIVFGEADGILIGTLDDTEVYLIFHDVEFDPDWTEEEQNEIYAMQEDVNYTIGMLGKEAGFKPAS